MMIYLGDDHLMAAAHKNTIYMHCKHETVISVLNIIYPNDPAGMLQY